MLKCATKQPIIKDFKTFSFSATNKPFLTFHDMFTSKTNLYETFLKVSESFVEFEVDFQLRVHLNSRFTSWLPILTVVLASVKKNKVFST